MAARRGIRTGFRCGMATAVDLYGRNEFRKQPEPITVLSLQEACDRVKVAILRIGGGVYTVELSR